MSPQRDGSMETEFLLICLQLQEILAKGQRDLDNGTNSENPEFVWCDLLVRFVAL